RDRNVTGVQTCALPILPVAGPDRRFMSLISYLGGRFDVMGNKWYGSNIENQKKNLPRSIHTFTLNDKETGAPLSIMAGNLVSSRSEERRVGKERRCR